MLSLKKNQKIKMVCESSFLYFWKKMNCVSYMIYHEIKDISRLKQNNEIYIRKIDFSQKN